MYEGVSPTHVGIYPGGYSYFVVLGGLPHTSGDLPGKRVDIFMNSLSPPHTWGSTPKVIVPSMPCCVSPTHVGIYPIEDWGLIYNEGLPHLRRNWFFKRTSAK